MTARTWGTEPGPEVTKVRDREGDLWFRVSSGWSCPARETEEMARQIPALPWSSVLNYAPLTDETTVPAAELAELKAKLSALVSYLDNRGSQAGAEIRDVLDGKSDPREW